MSIRARLLWLVIALSVPAVVLATIAGLLSYQHERERVELHLGATARASALAVDRELRGFELALQVLASSSQITASSLEEFHRSAREALLPNGQWVILHDRSGRQLVNTAVPYGTALPQSARDDIARRVAETGRSELSPLSAGAMAHEWAFAFYVPIMRDAQVAYVLAVSVLPSALSRVLSEQRLPANWVGSIFDQAGIHVARTHRPDRFVGHTGAPALMARMKEVPEGFVETRTLEGIPVLAGFSRSPTYGWAFAIGVPTSELYASAWRSALWIMAVSGTLLGLGFQIAIRMARPLIGHPAAGRG